MFFLGIAGPFIPYFLMMGILIAFTLEISMEKLRKPEKVSPDHHFRLLTAETETAPEHCYYFDTQSDQTHQQDLADNRGQFRSHLPPPGIKNGRKIISCNDSLPSENYIGCYFGLSPPYKFVS